MTKFNLKQIVFPFFLSLIFLASCKEEYYQDGGVHKAQYDGTILSFLKSRPELFDSLVKVIDLAGYSSLLDKPDANITFFAPANQSVARTILELNRRLYFTGQDTVLNLDQVSPSVWNKYLSMYIYEDKYLLKDYPQVDTNDILTYPGQGYISIKGEPVNIGVFYNDVTSKNSAGVVQVIKYAGYRQVLIGYFNPVATSDIQPTNGIVHVLQFNRHSFGFNAYDFTTNAISSGISY